MVLALEHEGVVAHHAEDFEKVGTEDVEKDAAHPLTPLPLLLHEVGPDSIFHGISYSQTVWREGVMETYRIV